MDLLCFTDAYRCIGEAKQKKEQALPRAKANLCLFFLVVMHVCNRANNSVGKSIRLISVKSGVQVPFCPNFSIS